MSAALHFLEWWFLAALMLAPLIGRAIETPDDDEMPRPAEPEAFDLNPRGRQR